MSQLYFKINLNKYGELKQKQEAEKRTFVTICVSFALVMVIMIGFTMYMGHMLNTKYQNRVKLIRSIRTEIKKYKDSGEYLSSKDLERLNNLSNERIFWAKKLVALAEKTTDKIAITHFSFKSGVLSLYGITKLDKNVKEHELINNFIQKLKANKQISSDFTDIKFVSSRSEFEKDVEIVRFQIDLSKGGKK